MSEEKQSLQQQADRTRPSSRKPVLVYLVILFAAAFILLLLAFFMQKRANDVAIDNLEQSSHSTAQSMEQLLAENQTLESQLADTMQALQSVQGELDQAAQQIQELENQRNAILVLETLEYLCQENDLAQALEYNGGVKQLPVGDLLAEAERTVAGRPLGQPTLTERYQAVLTILEGS